MRVVFFQNIHEELTGPLLLADLLQQRGHEVRFVLRQRGWLRRLRRLAPKLVAASVCSGDHHRLLQMADRIKASLRPAPWVVLGGPHPTHFPEIIEHPAVDAICRGEGDLAFPDFVDRCAAGALPGDVPGLWVKAAGRIHKNEPGPLVADLDAQPFPSRRQLYDDYPHLRRFPYRKTITARGCQFDCSYCSNHALRALARGKGRYLRRRGVRHVVDELKYLRDTFGCSYVDFNDDIFNRDRRWVLRFCQIYGRELGIPFGCNIHVRFLDLEQARALKEAGCNIAKFGLESGDQDLRRMVLNKTVTDEQILRAGEILHRAGLPFQTYNMIGLPGETIDQAFETVRLNQRIRPSYAWCALAQPLPGTRLARLFAERGQQPLSGLMDQFPVSWFHRSLLPPGQRGAMENLQKLFALVVRYPGLEPLARRAIRLPPNPAFRALSQAFFGLTKRELVDIGWWQVLGMYLRLRAQY
jgi:radical SAM superfamily enzyme YgiQ (UPF0313 family)